ncbi:MAG: molybdopterin-dependent oxidoreductase [Bellilinea sp.]|jgi:anaerobic selenocysteine-containing dehydrogenase
MANTISRRDFLKLAGVGAAVSAVLTGCGPMARYIVRRPYTNMPEYNQTGLSTYYASTCRECPAGCGIIVRTKEGRAITIEGNSQHPVNRGRLCSRGVTAQQGLYNPDRIRNPVFQARGDASRAKAISWDEAISLTQNALSNQPEQTAFLLGMAPDHLFDLVSELTSAIGAPPPVRYNALTTFEGRATLLEATTQTFNQAALPYFDLANADMTFAFGANLLENFLSPVAYSRAYGEFRQGRLTRRGYLVVFEPRQSLTAGNADEWIPIRPGSEAILAAAFNRLVSEARGLPATPAYSAVTLAAAAAASGVSEEKMLSLARMFASAAHPLAIPGGAALAQTDGLTTARLVLNLNRLVENVGQPGGVFLSPSIPSASDFAAVKDLVGQMADGKVKVLFIHGVNPLFELPQSLGFADALAKVPLVISFASFPDETALVSDYILPDHTPLESFGYQRVLAGSDRPALSSLQPVVVPLYDTRASADVLIAAARGLAGPFANALPYSDEVDFIQLKIVPLIQAGGFFTAPEVLTFWTRWLQHGGWWTAEPALTAPQSITTPDTAAVFTPPPALEEGRQFYLTVFPNHFGDGSGANRPWLQELPDWMTTVTWNSWVEIHPQTADDLGLHDDDIVRISTPYGFVEASVYRYPAIRPDTIAIPFGQGHTALGRWAEGRGCNPAQLLPASTNAAGDLTFGTVVASITPTGKRRPLARVESKEGIYGKH